jgi:hypothetical protein
VLASRNGEGACARPAPRAEAELALGRKPPVMGLWQVSGCRDAQADDLSLLRAHEGRAGQRFT